MPAIPTLTLADNADGTGTATVAGATSGSTNALYAAPWGGGFVPSDFTPAGSRVGNGTIAIALAAGYYWCYVLSTLSGQTAISLVHGLRITDGELSIHEQCLDAAAAKIAALDMEPPWTAIKIIKQKFPWNRGVLLEKDELAAIWVTPLNDQIRPVLNQADDFGLGVQITAAQKTNQHLTDGLTADLLCRQQLINAFLPVAGQAALAGVAEVHDVRIEPGPVIDPAAFGAQYDVSAFVIRCFNRRTRGLA